MSEYTPQQLASAVPLDLDVDFRAALLDRCGGSEWWLGRLFAERHPELSGLTGSEALRRGWKKALLETAEAISSGDFA